MKLHKLLTFDTFKDTHFKTPTNQYNDKKKGNHRQKQGKPKTNQKLRSKSKFSVKSMPFFYRVIIFPPSPVAVQILVAPLMQLKRKERLN